MQSRKIIRQNYDSLASIKINLPINPKNRTFSDYMSKIKSTCKSSRNKVVQYAE